MGNGTKKDEIDRREAEQITREEFERLLRQAGFSKVHIHTKEGTDWICAEGRA